MKIQDVKRRRAERCKISWRGRRQTHSAGEDSKQASPRTRAEPPDMPGTQPWHASLQQKKNIRKKIMPNTEASSACQAEGVIPRGSRGVSPTKIVDPCSSSQCGEEAITGFHFFTASHPWDSAWPATATDCSLPAVMPGSTPEDVGDMRARVTMPVRTWASELENMVPHGDIVSLRSSCPMLYTVGLLSSGHWPVGLQEDRFDRDANSPGR